MNQNPATQGVTPDEEHYSAGIIRKEFAGYHFEPILHKPSNLNVLRYRTENLDETALLDGRPKLWCARYDRSAAFLIAVTAARDPAINSPASELILTSRIPRAAHAEVIATSLV